jgi:NADH-quinone oxidoreductase subunit L
MATLAQIAPFIILVPALGAFINFFWGMKMGERTSGLVGIIASSLTFVIALGLLSALIGNDYNPIVVNPPFLDNWIKIDTLEISWATRVDTLSVTMLLFVTFVGTLIHIYASGYMTGDARFPRFFAYLNMFLAFMLILITGNNFLMMFVGWEGVGLCSYLLIGYWWDKPNGEGWRNSNAARKAFIANRIGDFGVLMAIFMMFWAFGTLDFYKAGEEANPTAGAHHGEEVHAEDEADTHGEVVPAEEDTHGEVAPVEEDTHSEAVPTTEAEGTVVTFSAEEGEGEGDAHGAETTSEEEGHGAPEVAYISYQTEGVEMHQLGVFGQTAYMVKEQKESGEAKIFKLGTLEISMDVMLVLITLFMLLGATGKSAQIPLFVWLPDAMAGPTPVSALIHAATMVTAGVYMMVRSNILFYNAELTSFIVTLVGGTTAIVAGFIAMGQFDIKRVLAYSTVSQLGFMVAAVGLGAYVAAIFHMMTHAFFKALLFLGSGSVIHGVEHGHHHAHEHGHGHDDDHHDDDHHDEHFDPQDMRNMGGLSKKMPITYITYLIGTFALAGLWPFAGFWSKDEILADAWLVGFEKGNLKGFIALGLLIAAAGFTAFYMWRQIEMVFHGKARTEASEQASENGSAMVTPLVILAFFSLFIGFINIPTGAGLFAFGFDGSVGLHVLGNFLEHSIFASAFVLPPFQPLIAFTALGIGISAIILARGIYGGVKAINAEGKDPLEADPAIGVIWGIANARMYWDEIYYILIIRPYIRIGEFLANAIDWVFLHDYFHDSFILKGYKSIGQLLAKPIDLGIIDGTVNGLGALARRTSGIFRKVQTGYVRTYALALFLGVVLVLVLMLVPLITNGAG